uniref:Uncharacterized protein n=1 Tax=Candidatus Kentrum sp. LFY TaxID=2126342 RepID=A0A450UID1_9GAMM|nr:MAG: hypothetical protein BECKLFY1418A_GA0070994_10224 [Candidatus Kentron sp. LFY]
MTYPLRYRKNKNPERTSAPAKTHPASVLARSANMSSMRWNFGSGFAGLGDGRPMGMEVTTPWKPTTGDLHCALAGLGKPEPAVDGLALLKVV